MRKRQPAQAVVEVADAVRSFSRVFMSSARAQVQALEARELLSTSPLLSSIHVDGTNRYVTGVVLTFNESLNPATVANGNSYVLGKVPPQNSSSGITLGDILGLLSKRAKPALARPADVVQPWVKLGKIQWQSISYDDSTHSVTLTPVKTFNGNTFFRMLRVKGTGQYAIKDMAGDPLSAGTDEIVRWHYRTGKTLHYTDKDGDQVTLNLKGPGTISTFIRINGEGEPRPMVFVSKTTSKSVLTGKIVKSSNGNGTTVLEQFSGSTVKNNIVGNSHFVIVST